MQTVLGERLKSQEGRCGVTLANLYAQWEERAKHPGRRGEKHNFSRFTNGTAVVVAVVIVVVVVVRLQTLHSRLQE